MFERARKNVSDDFHIAMRVRRKSLARLYAIFIDNAQAAKMHVRRIVILIERKGVIRIQPAKIKVARSEEHTSELQSQSNLVCRLLLEKKKKKITTHIRVISNYM